MKMLSGSVGILEVVGANRRSGSLVRNQNVAGRLMAMLKQRLEVRTSYPAVPHARNNGKNIVAIQAGKIKKELLSFTRLTWPALKAYKPTMLVSLFYDRCHASVSAPEAFHTNVKAPPGNPRCFCRFRYVVAINIKHRGCYGEWNDPVSRRWSEEGFVAKSVERPPLKINAGAGTSTQTVLAKPPFLVAKSTT